MISTRKVIKPEEEIRKADILIEAMPYMQSYRDKTILIKFGGSAMDDPELVKSLMRDIVVLEAMGMNPVVVHGGGKAIDGNVLSLEKKVYNAKDVGKVFEVMVEGVSKRSKEQLFGRTQQNKVVVFNRGNHRIGDFVNVKVTASSSATLIGEEVFE